MGGRVRTRVTTRARVSPNASPFTFRYVELNATGLRKILKKHDKRLKVR